MLANRELRVGATQQQAKGKSTREPARKASTVAPVTGQQRGRTHPFSSLASS